MSANEKRRFQAFAEFIRKTYPDSRTVADVAGGHGKLSYFLLGLGYEPTVIDTREASLPRRMQKALRKASQMHARPLKITRVVRRVQDADLRPYDLIAGLHPDGATEHALRTAIKLGKDFAFVPCCVFPIDGIKRSQENWLEYLASLSPDITTERLPIDGANVVLHRSTDRESC